MWELFVFLYHLSAFPWLRGGVKKALGTRLRLHPDFNHAFRNWVSYVFVQGQPPVVRRCPYAQVVLPTGKRSHFFQRTPAGRLKLHCKASPIQNSVLFLLNCGGEKQSEGSADCEQPD